MKKRLSAQVLGFALLIAFASVGCGQMAEKGQRKTVTIPSSEVILDSVFAVKTFHPLQS